jgi:hypothetical protein
MCITRGFCTWDSYISTRKSHRFGMLGANTEEASQKEVVWQKPRKIDDGESQ